MTAEDQYGEMYSGDSQSIRATVTDEAGDPVDLSSSDLTFVLAEDGSAAVTKTTGDGISVTGADDNVAVVDLDAEDTDDLDGAYDIELQQTDSGGNVATLTRGTLSIKSDLIE
ncbi:hypothetical protein HZS55_09125 [Halosimplex rubrum]|uniref:Ig-like domain-containing protein n=1 Tax=Halosimplex rubrum TaxID=869889 RepID=A0A7D5NZY3_9EURY|nr:hypothetical protein [Halosimplex rubrum]QLH77446.1 hypothetical protein HZS55_09125 [Halosimplex rubrum]